MEPSGQKFHGVLGTTGGRVEVRLMSIKLLVLLIALMLLITACGVGIAEPLPT